MQPSFRATAFGCRIINFSMMLIAQLLTNDAILKSLTPNHLYYYLAATSFLTTLVVLPLRDHEIVIDAMDLGILEVVFFVTAGVSYGAAPDFCSTLLGFSGPILGFLFSVNLLRLIYPQTLSSDRWPPLGIIGLLHKRSLKGIPRIAWLTIALTFSISIAVAAHASSLPHGWSQVFLGAIALILIAKYGKSILAHIVGLIQHRHVAVETIARLEQDLAEAAAALTRLRDSLAMRAHGKDISSRESAGALIDGLQPSDKQLLATVAILRPEIKAELIDYVLAVASDPAACKGTQLTLAHSA